MPEQADTRRIVFDRMLGTNGVAEALQLCKNKLEKLSADSKSLGANAYSVVANDAAGIKAYEKQAGELEKVAEQVSKVLGVTFKSYQERMQEKAKQEKEREAAAAAKEAGGGDEATDASENEQAD